MSFRLEKEIKQLMVDSSGFDKAQGLKKEKAIKESSGLKKEIKHLKAKSSGLDKT